ncbi:MAG: beta-lactamase family protein [Bacteroidia bacterium]|nr:beta-lactamase family protein [Bacteroidia bacterium]
MKFVNLLLIYFVFALSNFSAQILNKAKLDSFFIALDKKNMTMGSVAISKNGKLIYSKAFGSAVITKDKVIPNTVSTKFRVGSVTKMFTAVLIFQLIDENKISLSTTLNNYFPELPNANKITIAHLLNHSSGLHNYNDVPDYPKWAVLPKTQKDIFEIIINHKFDFLPGERHEYSNSNYYILSCIIEKITKKTYEENIKNRITSKLKLNNTYVGSKIKPEKNECYSYIFDAVWMFEMEVDMSIPHGAGAIVSTPADLTKFMEALFSNKLISKNSLVLMTEIHDNFGVGIFQMPWYNKKVFGHNGNIDNFYSAAVFFPDEKLSVALCINGTTIPFNDVMIGLLSIYFNLEYSVPK